MSKKEIYTSIFDFYDVIKKYRTKILAVALISGAAAAVYTAIKPLKFTAEATFREEGQIQSESRVSTNLSIPFLSSSDQSKAISFFKSRLLIEKVIQKLNLQAALISRSKKPAVLENFFNNLRIELSGFLSSLKQSPLEKSDAVVVSDLIFTSIKPLKLKFKTNGDNGYLLIDDSKTTYEGFFGKPLLTPEFSLTLDLLDEKELAGLDSIVLNPLHEVVRDFVKLVDIKPDLKDKKLVTLSLTYPHRKIAIEFLDSLMDVYLKHQHEKSERLSKTQLNYLKKRQNEETDALKSVLNFYADELSSQVSNSGFPKGDDAMRFLVTKQFELKQKEYALILEIKRFKEMEEGKLVFYDHYASSDSTFTNTLLEDIRQNKMKADEILHAINQNENKGSSLDGLTSQIEALDQTRKTIKNLQKLKETFLTSLGDYSLNTLAESSFGKNSGQIKSWLKKLSAVKKENSSLGNDDFKSLLEKFNSYIATLLQYYKIQEKTLEERLVYQTEPAQEFEGLTLEMSEKLLTAFSEDLNATQTQLSQEIFILDCIHHTEAELSPLNAMAQDRVSQEILTRYSKLLLELKDESNRSQKEQERIKAELEFNRTCFENHINQSISWFSQKTETLKNKIRSLKENIFLLYQQNVLLLEKQLFDYTKSKIANLEKEKELIGKHLQLIQEEMSNVPKNWVSDILIQYKVDSAKLFGRQISQLVESKNIAMNLELTKSHPVDLAFAELTPKPPFILFFAFLGFMGGSFLSLILFVAYEGAQGLTISCRNLKSSEIKSVGPFIVKEALNENTVSDNNLNKLRELMSFIGIGDSKTVLLAMGRHFDYSKELLFLLKTQRKKILLLDLTFSELSHQEGGLLPYLKGERETVSIEKSEDFDFLRSGGISRFSIEFLQTTAFKELLQTFKAEYDLVIGLTHMESTNTSLKNLILLFKKSIISVSNERVKKLEPLFSIPQDEASTLFLFME